MSLRGFKVLDLSRILAGPYCTMMLGDMGADVIKVESLQGDDTRQWGPPFVRGESTYFLSVNRNKRSICIDLKSRRGVDLVHRLAARSDVVVENFKPGDADRLGIGYKHLSQVNRSLIYAAVTGFGNKGVDRDRLAYDMFISAYGGLMSITGGTTPEPAKVGVAITDVTTGMLLCNAVVAALLQRERSVDKIGQRIDTSLFEAQLSALVNVASATLIADAPPKRYGTAHPSIVPYQVFHAKDNGHVAVGALNDQQHVRLLGALATTFADDAAAAAPLRFLNAPEFSSNAGRVGRRDEYLAQLGALLLRRTAREWQTVFDAAHVPCTPVNSVKEAFNLPQAKALDMIVELDHPTVGRIKSVGMPVKMSATPWSARTAPPTLGQHTNEILESELQCNADDIASLRAEKVVQ
jgi:formyl-CoA transferase